MRIFTIPAAAYPEPPKMSSSAQPIRKLNNNEIKELKGNYEQMLRQLRIFFRDLLSEPTQSLSTTVI